MFGIPKKTIPIQVHFFLMYAGICPMAVFGSTIIKQFGFSTEAVALIYFFVPVTSVFCRVIMGMVADKYHLLKTIKVACLTGCAIAVLLVSLLPKRNDETVRTKIWCAQNETIVEGCGFDNSFYRAKENIKDHSCQILCPNNTDFQTMCSDWRTTAKLISDFNCEQIEVNLEFFIPATVQNDTCHLAKIQKVINGSSELLWPRCSTYREAFCSISCSEKDSALQSALKIPSFWYLFILYVIFGAGYSVAVTFSDTICFQVIGEETHLYGKLRVPGSFGWGLGGFFTGMLIDYFSGHNSVEKNYAPMFTFVIAVFLIDAFWSCTLKAKRSSANTFNLKNVYGLFARLEVKQFAVWSFLAGFFQQVTWQYTFWYLEDIAKGDDVNLMKTLQGFLSFSNTVTGDVLSFYTSGWLFKKFGFKNCMSASLVLTAARYFLYSILTKPLWAIPIASLDGIIYGLQYALIASYCNSIAAPGTEATVQAVFNCIFDGIGTSMGGLFGGFLYSWYGGASMFKIFGVSSFGCFVLHLLVRYFSTLKKKLEPGL